MKFSQKIFTTTFVLMLLSMYFMGGWMITYNHRENITREVTRSANETAMLLSSIQDTFNVDRLKGVGRGCRTPDRQRA